MVQNGNRFAHMSELVSIEGLILCRSSSSVPGSGLLLAILSHGQRNFSLAR